MAARDLEKFLSRQKLVSQDTAQWRDGIELQVSSYLCSETPPVDVVSSVRAVVFKEDRVLVMRNLDGIHILPGGRVEEAEAHEDTLHRELLEEAGIEIRIGAQIGLIHLRHTTPKPKGYRYPYPDFLWPVYVASFVRERPDAKVADGYEVESEFLPLEEVQKLAMGPHEKVFLEAAVEAKKPTG